MQIHKAYFLDADYIVRNNKTYIRLLVKGKKLTRLYFEYEPYFYVDCDENSKKDIEKIHTQAKNGKMIKVARVEGCEKIISGKQKNIMKVFCHAPGDVPLIKQAIPFTCYEYNIPFTKRFIFDMKLIPFSIIHYKRDGRIIKDITKIEQSDKVELDTLSFDIETYNPLGAPRENKDPIIMISYAGKHSGVISYKKAHKEFLQVVQDEKDMLERFSEIIEQEAPDVIFGYNTSNFDLPYLEKRSDLLKARLVLGRTKLLKKIRKGMVNGMRIDGRIHIDVYPAVRFFGFIGLIKAQEFTLRKISEEVIGKKKIDLKMNDIWQLWDKNKIEELAEYSLVDAQITKELGDHFLPLQIELSRVAKMTLFDVALSTSGQLVENLLMYEATQKNMISPSRPSDSSVKERMANPIEGAYVKIPEPGIYNNIAVMDFRGLYPSIIVSYNIDPLTIDKNGDENCFISPTGAKFLKKPLGLIPSVVDWLLDYRIKIKQELKKAEKGSAKYKTLEARSHALKILTNSVYGYTAYPRARWYSRECGESTTAWGRKHIQETIKAAEEAGFKVLYGDSLHPERKIFIQEPTGQIKLVKIGEFVDRHYKDPQLSKYKTLAFDGKKLVFANIKRAIKHPYSKEDGELLEFITNRGKTIVTPQHSIYAYFDNEIKLKDAKELRINDLLISFTNSLSSEIFKENHIFDITKLDFGPYSEDTFLYSDNLRFKPEEKYPCPYCSKTVFLARHVSDNHKDRRVPLNQSSNPKLLFIGSKNIKSGRIPRYWKLTKDLAWLFGYFAAEGSASEKNTKHNKAMISFGSQDRKIIEKVKSIISGIINEDLAIIEYFDKRINKKMYYYRVQRKSIVALFVHCFGLGKGSNGKQVPWFILNGDLAIKKAFLDGYLEGDGTAYQDPRYKTHFQKFSTKSLDLAIGLSYLFKCLPNRETNKFNKKIEHVHWRYRKDKPGIIDLRFQAVKEKEFVNFSLAKIKEINKVDYKGYVYDLEVVGSHNFLDAEGLILVHNTDSLMILYEDKNKVLDFLEKINKSLPEKMELELENFYTRGVFVSKRGGEERGAKKKYAMLSEDGRIKIRGFELVRRDWSEIAKSTQLKVLEAILREGSKEKAVDIVRKTIQRLREGTVPLEELAIMTQLSKDTREYDIVSPEVSAAKKMIANGMPMEKGSVVSYVITKKGKSVSEKAHPLEMAKDYDADYYINNQVLPAVMKILKELGYEEYDLKIGGKQKGLGDFV